MKILQEFIKQYVNEIKLNEGLIKTVNIYKTKNILEKKFGKYFYFEISGLNAQTLKPIKNKIGAESIKECPKDVFIDFIKWANNLGWFISIINYDVGIQIKYKNGIENKIYNKYNTEVFFNGIVLEAKYDELIDPIPEKLYHVTKPEHAEKIERIGLSPKSVGKLSNHPERIYFGFTVKDVLDLAEVFKILSNNDFYVLYEINTDLVPAYLKLYADPNYHGKGCYTMNNIPPSAITKKSIVQV